MVDRLIEQMEAIRIVLCDDRSSYHLIPSWQDCDILLSITAALKPLKAMTGALSGESCITLTMDLIPYSFAPLILFLIPYTLDLLL